MVVEVEDEGSSERLKVASGNCSGRRCSSAGSCGRSVEGSSVDSCRRRFCRIFHVIQRKKVRQDLPHDPAEERCLPLDHGEDPAEPSSAGYILLSRKNLQKLLPQGTFSSRGRSCGSYFADHVLLCILFFLDYT